jgi:hypothetical protein
MSIYKCPKLGTAMKQNPQQKNKPNKLQAHFISTQTFDLTHPISNFYLQIDVDNLFAENIYLAKICFCFL